MLRWPEKYVRGRVLIEGLNTFFTKVRPKDDGASRPFNCMKTIFRIIKRTAASKFAAPTSARPPGFLARL